MTNKKLDVANCMKHGGTIFALTYIVDGNTFGCELIKLSLVSSLSRSKQNDSTHVAWMGMLRYAHKRGWIYTI
jgi:hypothetical protein